MIVTVMPELIKSIRDSMDHMFQLPLPVIEKLVRPIIVYAVLVGLLRLFGKRELAQLNPFDLVVLLSLSNTVQNAIIGEDNSVSGGIIGAFSLLAINWLVAKMLFRSPKLTRLVEGRSTLLVKNGKMDEAAMKRESLTTEELMSAIHKQGFTHLHDVRRCELEPSGTFFVEGSEPSYSEREYQQLMEKLEELMREVKSLRDAQAG